MISKAPFPRLYQKCQKVYNSLVGKRQRYTPKTVSRETVARLQREFLKLAGPSMKLMWELSDSFPDIALTVKNRDGRIGREQGLHLDAVLHLVEGRDRRTVEPVALRAGQREVAHARTGRQRKV